MMEFPKDNRRTIVVLHWDTNSTKHLCQMVFSCVEELNHSKDDSLANISMRHVLSAAFSSCNIIRLLESLSNNL